MARGAKRRSHSHRAGHGPTMAQKGLFDPPKGSGATFKRSHFDRFWAPIGVRHGLEIQEKQAEMAPKGLSEGSETICGIFHC